VKLGLTTPSAEEFAQLDQPLVPVVRRLLADGETAVGVYRKLAGNRPGTFLLESAEQGKQWSRWSFVGVRCAGVLTERDGRSLWLGDAPLDLPEDPLEAVRVLAWSATSATTSCGGSSGCPARLRTTSACLSWR
jgi:anthranilate synthase component 1